VCVCCRFSDVILFSATWISSLLVVFLLFDI
jgi:hypothetical protein